jgi:hypothetical protein
MRAISSPRNSRAGRGVARHAGLAVAVFACASTSLAQGRAGADQALVGRLTAQADAWDKAIVRKDRAAIEANIDVYVRQAGAWKIVSVQISPIPEKE